MAGEHGSDEVAEHALRVPEIGAALLADGDDHLPLGTARGGPGVGAGPLTAPTGGSAGPGLGLLSHHGAEPITRLPCGRWQILSRGPFRPDRANFLNKPIFFIFLNYSDELRRLCPSEGA